jgi:hypothetical protein
VSLFDVSEEMNRGVAVDDVVTWIMRQRRSGREAT